MYAYPGISIRTISYSYILDRAGHTHTHFRWNARSLEKPNQRRPAERTVAPGPWTRDRTHNIQLSLVRSSLILSSSLATCSQDMLDALEPFGRCVQKFVPVGGWAKRACSQSGPVHGRRVGSCRGEKSTILLLLLVLL